MMSDLVDALMGGLAGASAGLVAGPPAMIVGASLGFVAGFALGHHANREQHEQELHIRELDDFDRDITLQSMRTVPVMAARNP
ncbi:MAG: hypothetical protein JNK04_02670 [Myxococcales bacterium]|nr:hypothetical protein [Myxococcales bacterium]